MRMCEPLLYPGLIYVPTYLPKTTISTLGLRPTCIYVSIYLTTGMYLCTCRTTLGTYTNLMGSFTMQRAQWHTKTENWGGGGGGGGGGGAESSLLIAIYENWAGAHVMHVCMCTCICVCACVHVYVCVL